MLAVMGETVTPYSEREARHTGSFSIVVWRTLRRSSEYTGAGSGRAVRLTEATFATPTACRSAFSVVQPPTTMTAVAQPTTKPRFRSGILSMLAQRLQVPSVGSSRTARPTTTPTATRATTTGMVGNGTKVI